MTSRPRLPVLVVEDQPAVGHALAVMLSLRGIEARVVRDAASALAALGETAFGVVVQDMNFSAGATSGEEGVALFRELRRRDPGLAIVLLTAWSSLETAVALVREGAADYLAKPWDDETLGARIETLLASRLPELGEATQRRAWLAERYDLCGTVWASAAMERVIEQTLRAAGSRHPVLISGASGAGKEKIADLLHANSPRRDRPFVRVHAGALPEQLVEAELFGVEAGAYTGAVRRLGRFEAADRGTLFLDEIATLPLAGQAKLLRILQGGDFERLGSPATRRVDVRVVCATNEDLEALASAGRFRADLYWRLAVVRIEVPDLAARPGDAVAIAEHLLAAAPPCPTGHAWRLTAEARAAIDTFPWPGNVRQLENVLRRAMVDTTGPDLDAAALGLGGPAGFATAPTPDPGRRAVEQALEAAGGIVAHAAESLGISRQALYRRMERYGLTIDRAVRR